VGIARIDHEIDAAIERMDEEVRPVRPAFDP
jgi:hypothetical protein